MIRFGEQNLNLLNIDKITDQIEKQNEDHNDEGNHDHTH